MIVHPEADYEFAMPDITDEDVRTETHDFKRLLRVLGVNELHTRYTYYTGNLTADRGSKKDNTFNSIVDAKARAALALYDHDYAILSQKRVGPSKYEYYITVKARPSKERMRRVCYENILRQAARDAQLTEMKEPSPTQY